MEILPQGIATWMHVRCHLHDTVTRTARKGPVALRMAKLAIDRGIQLSLDNGLAFERQW